ncbi:MAG: hypothetical protein ACREGF_01770 [Candidatus Saccharimonadales bacterium]
MRTPHTIVLKKLSFLLLFFALNFLSQSSSAQTAPDTAIEYFVVYRSTADYKPFPVTGRVIGINNLEIVKGATVINICTGETTRTNNNGIYHTSGAKDDTLAFVLPKYSASLRCIKSPKEKINVILFNKKVDGLHPGYSRPDYNRAVKDDKELLKILEKDAKLEGKWKY